MMVHMVKKNQTIYLLYPPTDIERAFVFEEDAGNIFSMETQVMLDICWSVNGSRCIRLISGEAHDQMAQSSIMRKSLQLLSRRKAVMCLLQHFTVISSVSGCFCGG